MEESQPAKPQYLVRFVVGVLGIAALAATAFVHVVEGSIVLCFFASIFLAIAICSK